MGTVLIIVPPKRIDLLQRVLQPRAPVDVKTLLAEPAVERFDRGVVRPLAPTTEVEADAMGRGQRSIAALTNSVPLSQ